MLRGALHSVCNSTKGCNVTADDKGKQAVLEAIDCFETISDERLGGDDLAEAMEQVRLARQWVEAVEADAMALRRATALTDSLSGPGDAR